MTQHTRQFEVARASVDPEAGTFEAVLFTDGEAQDGHVLNIKGGKIPDRMPLFVNHYADPTEQLGSLYYAGRNEHEVLVRGEIFLEGEGAPLEVRKDMLAKMAAGHVSRMSGRWDADDKHIKRRVNLPSDHPAFVDDSKEVDSRKKWGLYFEKWEAMEGSVVGLGADPQAVMRWANDDAAPECVREFWRGQVPKAQLSGVLDALLVSVREAIAAGVDPDAISAAMHAWHYDEEEAAPEPETPLVEAIAREVEQEDEQEDEPEPDPDEEFHLRVDAIIERLDALDARITELVERGPSANEEKEREEDEGEPLPPSTPSAREITAHIRSQVDAANQSLKEEFRAKIRKARGGIT